VVRSRLLALALSLAVASSAAAASNLAPDIADAAQDGYGLVWAASSEGRLFVCEVSSWNAVPLPVELARAKFRGMHAAPDGQVVMLWLRENDKLALTESKGSAPRIRATLDGIAHKPTLFADSRGDVWLATPQRIYRFAKGAREGQLAFTIPPAFYDRVITLPENVSPIHAFEDQRGRIWFWSETRFRGSDASLRGFVIRDGDKWATATLDHLPAGRFASIFKRGAQTVWIAVHHEGLFSFNLETRETKRIEEPELHTFRNVRGLHRAGERTLLVSEAVVDRRYESVLWEERNGTWKKLVTGLDPALQEHSERKRAVLHLPDGAVLLGSFGSGMWLLRGDEAVRLDWRARVALAAVNRLLPLKRGEEFVAINFARGDTFIGRSKQLPKPHPQPRAAAFTLAPPVQDARKHLWATSRDRRSLLEWNGTTWAAHAKPDAMPYLSDELRVDADGRRIHVRHPKLATYDPAARSWEVAADPGPFTGSDRITPPDVQGVRADSAARDEHGTVWFTHNRGLHKQAFGRTATVLRADEPHPFLDGRRLHEQQPVLVDARGNAVLYANEIIIVPPKNAGPDTAAKLLQLDGNRARVEFSGSSAAMWRWRINDGAWSEAAAEPQQTIELPANGTHTIDVAAIDNELQIDSTPARLEVQVHVDWPQIFARDIEQLLNGTDRTRAAAIQSLQRNPDAALPLLREALPEANSSQRWWLEAAIQEMERTRTP
jgi:hypothetical protein